MGLSAIWIVRYTVTGLTMPGRDAAELLRGTLCTHTGIFRDLEHVTITATDQGIDLTMFLRHAVADPERTGQDVLDRAHEAAPILRCWIYLPLRARPPATGWP